MGLWDFHRQKYKDSRAFKKKFIIKCTSSLDNGIYANYSLKYYLYKKHENSSLRVDNNRWICQKFSLHKLLLEMFDFL